MSSTCSRHSSQEEQQVLFRFAMQQTRLLEQALAEKKKADLVRQDHDAFLSKIAHEMRNPLNGIFGITELLSTHPEVMTVELLAKLHSCSAMLAALIDDTLDLSRLEQKRLRLVKGVFHLAELLESVVEVHVSEAEAKEIRLSMQLDGELGFVEGDKLRVRQIVVNLVTNAIKYTPQGGEVVVRGLFENGCYALQVRDTGVGISEVDMRTLFQPFFQVNRVDSGSKRGIGLGLSIVKNLVDVMQGTMGVDSAPGQGSTFWVALPLPTALAPEPVVPADRPLRGRVLVVDDNAVNREILKLQLELRGVSVAQAQHGAAALPALEQETFDIVLMDVHMPIMDGYQTTKEIKAHPERYGQPTIIALTASATESSKKRCLSTGMDDFLCKPIAQGDLLAKLSAYLPREDSRIFDESVNNRPFPGCRQ